MKKKKKIQIIPCRTGSALIMTVVLTVLLAIVAVMFVAVARMDVAATSNIADNRTLDSAAKSVVNIIGKDLVLDTPGTPGQEYHDYADKCDPWLASLQPYYDTGKGIYKWHQISDVTGYLSDANFAVEDVNTEPPGTRLIKDYPKLVIDTNGVLQENLADADGDGVADSKWFELGDIYSSKGNQVYAAVRVIDNCAMINVNTAYLFDANSVYDANINGASQMQINLDGLLKGTDDINDLHDTRCGSEDSNWVSYRRNVIWEYDEPNGNYVPFDISDELELRYRYCIDSKVKARIEESALPDTLHSTGLNNYGHLYDDPGLSGSWGLEEWQLRVTDTNFPDFNDADRRRLLTTYNFDRVIDPNGNKMVNINDANVLELYYGIRRGLLDANSSFADVNSICAQLAVNIIDYSDNDSQVTDFNYPGDSNIYYGFEAQPFISEIAAKIDPANPDVPGNNFYALELYNPFNADISLSNFTLSIDNGGVPVADVSLVGTIPAYGYSLISNNLAQFSYNPAAAIQPDDGKLEFSGNYLPPGGPPPFTWNNYDITLKRTVGGVDIVLDVQDTNNAWFEPPVAPAVFSAQRDPNDWHIVYQVMNDAGAGGDTLGLLNTVSISGTNYNLALANKEFVTIGDIARPLTIGPNTVDAGTIGQQLASGPPEPNIRLNLADPNYQQIFNYLTVWPPSCVSDPNETRVKGRINLNTAPWYVIAQLPWVGHRVNYNDPNLAKAIVAYRDRTKVVGGDPDYSTRPGGPGIKHIGELCNITKGTDDSYKIDYYIRPVMAGDQNTPPDLDPNDGAPDDFEERDLIFARISNLVTVRSDVFTAYILVRIGTDGPQKRYMAILDRSGVVPDISNPDNRRVSVKVFQNVPPAK